MDYSNKRRKMKDPIFSNHSRFDFACSNFSHCTGFGYMKPQTSAHHLLKAKLSEMFSSSLTLRKCHKKMALMCFLLKMKSQIFI